MIDIVQHWPALMLVYASFALAVGSPGPSTLSIMATSMNEGRRVGLVLALGVTAGSVTWGLLASLGLSAVLAAYAPALYAIKVAGGLYLLYLAWRSACSAVQAINAPGRPTSTQPISGAQTFARGYLMHLTNPKAILGWIAIMTLGLTANSPFVVVVALLAGCALISLSFNCGYAVLFSTDAMVRGYRRIRRGIEGALAVVFAVAGLKLLTSR